MPNSLQITHVVLSLDVGGLERNVVNQVREGQRLGQRVAVICLEKPGTLAPQVEALKVPLICLQKRSGVRLQVIRQMQETLRQLHSTVVHTHQISALFYTGPAARAAGIPLIVHTEHGKQDYAGRWRRRWLGRLAGRYARRFFCLSEDMATEIVRQRIVPRPKVRVIPNGIDIARFQTRLDPDQTRQALGIPEGARVIGTVGRLMEVKRQDLLIHSFAKIRLHEPEAHLLLVGDGPRKEELSQLAYNLGLKDCVHFAGYQAQPEKVYQLMDVFALTSRSEGMPQALIEASAAGVPVVASRVGGIPEIVEDGRTAMLVPYGNEAALTQAIAYLLTNGEVAKRMGQAARERVEKLFHIRRMAADYQENFMELLSEPRSSAVGARIRSPRATYFILA